MSAHGGDRLTSKFPGQVCVAEACVGPAMVGKAQVSIVGTSVESPTLVTIESPVDLEIGDNSGATVTYPAGVAQGFSLERGQVLTVATTAVADADLIGMAISANHEIAVFSGSTCSMMSHGTFACDHLEQQRVHVVEANEPVRLNTYGYDCTVSYAYPGGLNLEWFER